MHKRNFTTIVGWLAAFCSITGITGLTVFSYFRFPDHPPFPFLKPPYLWLGVLLATGIGGIGWLGAVLYKRLQELEGHIVSREDRSTVSQAFAAPTLRSIDIFAGDLSWWLEEDLVVYRDLLERNVRVRILTDTPNAVAIQLGKVHGIKFRQYPDGMFAPIIASICDADEETECRALVVRRHKSLLSLQQKSPYGYWMKTYHGSVEYPIVKAMALLFNELWSRGQQL